MMKVNIFDNHIRQIPFNENEPYVEITDEQLEDFMKGKLKVENGVIVDNTESIKKQARITELKTLLLSTDYKAIKYAEGVLTEQEYLPIKEQRENWRKEINELEVLLNK